MTYLKEEDLDKFLQFIAIDVGNEILGSDFEVIEAEATDWETQACEIEDGSEELLSMVNASFTFESNYHDEDSWSSLRKGCSRYFYEDDFIRFYTEDQNDNN